VSGCPHCPDGHDDPTIKPWAVAVASERDGDGQPIRLLVQPTDGSHVASSDAEWVRWLLNDVAFGGKPPRAPHRKAGEGP